MDSADYTSSAIQIFTLITSKSTHTDVPFHFVVPGLASEVTKALDNLASVAINTSLVSDTDITDDLGTGDIRWNNCYVANLRSGLTVNDTLILQGRDTDGSWQDILTITSASTVLADLWASTTIGGNAIADASDNLSFFAATTSLQLLGVISDETGTGALVFGTAPTIASAVLNTAVSGTAVLDEDAMGSDSATQIATQQSIKKYVDDNTITLGTEQASTSGTAIDFTSIPAGTKKITIMFVGVSGDGTEELLIQIGDSGGVEATGYTSVAATASLDSAVVTSGFVVSVTGAAADVYHGSIILTLEDLTGFTWTLHSCFMASGGVTEVHNGAGSKSLSAELDRVRITFTGTPDDFDAGAINIQYE